ncbi:ABC transporter permease [Brevibacillus invocatus]|uniref:ABC transporter permease n=2 Tax=Brevibacillus invocatus TaxID=173959 RepID=A0A3M8BX51_9BACL|nr:ABC transporter permease [Brevibacillus invocatus]RNB68011.1 ABC transporter permease [Brevibacillus invocatus]
MTMKQDILKSKAAKISFCVLLVIVLLGIIGPWIAPYNPTESNFDKFLQQPSMENPLGTDAIGRDLLSRMLYGARETLMVAVMSVFITFFLGTLLGVTSAYIGGIFDNVMMRIMDVLLSLPGILLALAIVAILGPSQINAMIAIGISSIPSFARLIRSAALTVKTSGYIEASYAAGSSHRWIMVNHIVPNITSVLIVYTTMFVGSAILDTSALGFIGMGAQPPTPEWGTMLSEGKDYLSDAWWLATFPGLAITVIVLTINILGDELYEFFDPRSKHR